MVCWIKEKEVKLGRMWLESQVHDYTTTAHSGSYWLIHRMLGQFIIFLWSRVILQTTSLSFWGRFHDYFCHGTVDNHTRRVFQSLYSHGILLAQQVDYKLFNLLEWLATYYPCQHLGKCIDDEIENARTDVLWKSF